MLYYINQLHTPSSPIGLVKIKSDFIVKSGETNSSGKWSDPGHFLKVNFFCHFHVPFFTYF